MTISQEREDIRKRLQDKRHREGFVSATVNQTIPFQIRAMRLAKKRNWTQEELADRAGMKQERISTCENPNYGNFSLRTLKQLASAFDVALVVRFAPFSELVEWETNMSSECLEVRSFEEEDYFKEKNEKRSEVELLKTLYSEDMARQPDMNHGIVDLLIRKREREQEIRKMILQETTAGANNETPIR